MYDAIVISDLHIGANNSESYKLRKFLIKLRKNKLTKLLIINGDGFDNVNTKKYKKRHKKVIKAIKKLSKKIDIVWILGNHDNDRIYISKYFDNISIKSDLILKSGENNIAITHGHQYDKYLCKYPVSTHIADLIYNISQFIDPSHCLSRFLKRSSKKFLKVINTVKLGMVSFAISKKCKIAIHGHSHFSGHMKLNDISIWDSGCWTEKPCSYLTIKDGIISLVKV